jgi:hypothetical protein
LSKRGFQCRIQPNIEELLHTNRAPTDAQIRDINDLIQVQEIRRCHLEFERERLLRALGQIAQTLDKVSNMISDLQATLSPIKRMPEEILALIFEHCLPVRSPDTPFSHTQNFAPVLPGLVCSSWRQIAHAYPRLWCNVDLTINNIHGSTEIFTRTLPRLTNWVCHSGSLPLSLTLWSACDNIDYVCNAIALHAPRWRAMYISVNRSQVVRHSLSRMFAKSFTGLLALHMSHIHPSGFMRGPGEPISFDFQNLPLRNLSLCLQGLLVQSILVPCANMTTLSLDLEPPDSSTSSLGELLDVVRRCHSLEECTLFLRGGRELAPLPHVCLRQLQSLDIRILRAFGPGNQLANMLDVFNFPSLLSLKIAYSTTQRAPMAFPEQLNTFLRRHTSSLRRFVFDSSSPTLSANNFLKIIEGISSIKELDVGLHHSHTVVTLVEELTPVFCEGSCCCILPHLEAFTLRWDERMSFSCIAEMVEMRHAVAGSLYGIAQLKCITIGLAEAFSWLRILNWEERIHLANLRERVAVMLLDPRG